MAKFCVPTKKSNIERERVNVGSEPDFYGGNVRSETDFYWRNSPVNFKGQTSGGESFPTFPSGGYAHGGDGGTDRDRERRADMWRHLDQ